MFLSTGQVFGQCSENNFRALENVNKNGELESHEGDKTLHCHLSEVVELTDCVGMNGGIV